MNPSKIVIVSGIITSCHPRLYLKVTCMYWMFRKHDDAGTITFKLQIK